MKSDGADKILRPVILAYKQSPSEAGQDVLLYLCWTPLEEAHRRLRRLDPDERSRFLHVMWSYQHALHRLDPAERRGRLGQKLINDVQHDVRLAYERERAHQERMQPPHGPDGAPVEDPLDRIGSEDTGLKRVACDLDAGWASRNLKDLVRRGRLSRVDYLILLGCSVYGRSIQEMAARLDLSYEAARKRRQRADWVFQEIAKRDVPAKPPDPPKGGRYTRAPRRVR